MRVDVAVMAMTAMLRHSLTLSPHLNHLLKAAPTSVHLLYLLIAMVDQMVAPFRSLSHNSV